MSKFNFNWIKNNFDENVVLFDIGCGDLDDFSITAKLKFPKSKIYSFECNNDFKEKNLKKSLDNNINYYHLAISDEDGSCIFYPSDTFQGQNWSWSGSICRPGKPLMSSEWTWGTPYVVETKKLETFCLENNICPDFIWIDAQGAEKRILSCIGQFKPRAIWAETCEFNRYEDTKTDSNNFKKFMFDLGYIEWHFAGADSLFVLKNQKFTNYND